MFERKKQECRECDFVRELRELLRKFEESSERVRGSSSPYDPARQSGSEDLSLLLFPKSDMKVPLLKSQTPEYHGNAKNGFFISASEN